MQFACWPLSVWADLRLAWASVAGRYAWWPGSHAWVCVWAALHELGPLGVWLEVSLGSHECGEATTFDEVRGK